MEFLIENIRKHVRLTDEEAQRVLSFMDVVQIQAKGKALIPSQTCTSSHYVIEGILRAYYIDTQGNEHIVSFAPRGWWITDMFAFLSGRPSELYIESNDNVTALTLTRNAQLQLFDEVPAMERYFRILTENSLIANQLRAIETISHSAEQRYFTFCQKYPELMHKLPQKQIASYIGVTPEFFSKMKARINRK